MSDDGKIEWDALALWAVIILLIIGYNFGVEEDERPSPIKAIKEVGSEIRALTINCDELLEDITAYESCERSRSCQVTLEENKAFNDQIAEYNQYCLNP